MSSDQRHNHKQTYKCRACKSTSFSEFNYSHWVFKGKPPTWTNILCQECGLISHFKDEGQTVTYSDQAYRRGSANVYPPISLPWSTVSFKRWLHIARIVESHISEDVLYECSMLDYGGYNGLLARALHQRWGVDCTVADLDQEGLNFADAMGFKTINLAAEKKIVRKYRLITVVHVLEHIEEPSIAMSALVDALLDGGNIYIEVPNLYGFPMVDSAHLSTFTLESLELFCLNCGLEIRSSGYCKTPADAIHFGYPFSTDQENIYVFAQKSESGASDAQNSHRPLPSSDSDFRSELTKAYGRRGITIAAAYFRLGMLRLLFSCSVLVVSLVSLVPVLRTLVTSRTLYAYSSAVRNLVRLNAPDD